ncbi:hypothetical protein [Pseudomonas petrae]|uniref:Uncharacterized protein n=1 Tax=Pseudomonas petrae TaxID=2912190 RepID=A0ABS9I6Y4_9PSED|nr:hypothetical protein [Pseudomonas petrae]MCF7532179.1 hypothetical protein [Pseudomonas petrae]MCF7537712.1 hypothetical protein [Pseudomonas petrae]MCF7543504.1 hypothetical protein [Pseudomonas petrae]
MSSDSKKRIDPGKKYRRQAGPYDVTTHSPRYSFEVIAADDVHSRVIDNSQIMGVAGRHFFVWDITNDSHVPVFITLTKDGEPFDPAGSTEQ